MQLRAKIQLIKNKFLCFIGIHENKIVFYRLCFEEHNSNIKKEEVKSVVCCIHCNMKKTFSTYDGGVPKYVPFDEYIRDGKLMNKQFDVKQM